MRSMYAELQMEHMLSNTFEIKNVNRYIQNWNTNNIFYGNSDNSKYTYSAPISTTRKQSDDYPEVLYRIWTVSGPGRSDKRLGTGRLLVGGCPKHWPSLQALRTPYEKCQGLLDTDVSRRVRQWRSAMPAGFTVIPVPLVVRPPHAPAYAFRIKRTEESDTKIKQTSRKELWYFLPFFLFISNFSLISMLWKNKYIKGGSWD